MLKEKVAIFDIKSYDEKWFKKLNKKYDIVFIENKLNSETALLAKGCKIICGFVNDTIDKKTIDTLYDIGVRGLAMRSAGYNNVDLKAAYGKINIMRVPAYSPYSIAEHTMALLLALNRKIYKAYIRTRDFNFSLVGLEGMDLHGKTIGIIGTGKIGKVFVNICKGFGMNILAYDLYPDKNLDVNYVELDTLFRESDVISLHSPLTTETKHLISKNNIEKMKEGVLIINTSRGGLIDTDALIEGLNNKKIAGTALDVYEEEGEFFFEDFSDSVVRDEKLALLISKPNVLVTSHQGYFTKEALENITKTTLDNIDEFLSGNNLSNEVCYRCEKNSNIKDCRKNRKERCF